MAEVTFTAEQQEFVDKLVGDTRIKARTKAEADQAALAAKEAEETNRANLAAQEEWQKLATTHEARVKQLEPLEAQVKAYDELIVGMLKDRVKALGDAAKKAVDALPEAMTALDKLNWLNKNEGLFQGGSDGVGTPKRPISTTQKERPKGPTTRLGAIKL